MNAAPKSRAHLVERAVEAMRTGARPAAAPGAAPAPMAAPKAAPKAAVAEAPSREPPRPDPPAAANAPEAARAAPVREPAPPTAIPLAVIQAAGLVAMSSGPGRTRLSEEVAVVQQHVLRTLRGVQAEEGRASRVVLVTSARPGEGKTFTALNLAAAIASGGGYPTLLVDADGKRHSISELLGRQRELGLRALAVEPDRKAAPLPLPTEIARLSFLPYGATSPDATDDAVGVPPGTLLAGAILRLAAAFPKHVIIVDSPPCLAASDPGSLAAVAGQVLVVVRAETTQRNEVEAALDMVESCPTLQLVLNRTQVTMNDSFGAYGYGGYAAYGAAPPADARQ